MRLLLAEDDPLLGQGLSSGLAQLGYAVDWLTCGAPLRAAVHAHRYDCILLDLGLPDLPGEAFVQQLRRDDDPTPVIVISAREGKHSRISLLDQGADDYLAKPFDLDELAARVRAVVRRSGERAAGQHTVAWRGGTLVIHPAARTVLLDGQPRMLATKEFWLLEVLVRHRDRVVTRAELEDALYAWGEESSSNTIEVYIHQLRRKLGREAIKTVRGLGYRLARSDEF